MVRIRVTDHMIRARRLGAQVRVVIRAKVVIRDSVRVVIRARVRVVV